MFVRTGFKPAEKRKFRKIILEQLDTRPDHVEAARYQERRVCFAVIMPAGRAIAQNAIEIFAGKFAFA